MRIPLCAATLLARLVQITAARGDTAPFAGNDRRSLAGTRRSDTSAPDSAGNSTSVSDVPDLSVPTVTTGVVVVATEAPEQVESSAVTSADAGDASGTTKVPAPTKVVAVNDDEGTTRVVPPGAATATSDSSESIQVTTNPVVEETKVIAPTNATETSDAAATQVAPTDGTTSASLPNSAVADNATTPTSTSTVPALTTTTISAPTTIPIHNGVNWTTPTEVQTTPPDGRTFWITSDIDNCPYPDQSLFPVLPMPTDNHSNIIDEPTMRLWQAFRMDEWLTAAFDNCPAALGATVVGSEGETREQFSTVLGRLMLGRTQNARFTPVCNNFRCTWSTNGDPSVRGAVFPPEMSPDVWDGMDDDYIESYRRWYAMQALVNIWDYCQATTDALNNAVAVVNQELPDLINRFMPDYVAAVAPPSPVGPFLDIINTIATFTPFGSYVHIAITAIKSVADIDRSGTPKTIQLKSSDVAADAVKFGETMDKADRIEVARRLSQRRTAIKNAVGNAILLTKQIGYLTDALNDNGTPAHWRVDPVMPVKWATLSKQFGTVIAAVASNLQRINQQRLNGDPKAEGGYFDMVIGGLYSGWSNSGSTIDDLSLASVGPMYMAYIEDKIFQSMMRSNQLWLLKRDAPDQAACTSMDVPQNWEGIACAQNDDGTWSNYIPYMTDFAVETPTTELARRVGSNANPNSLWAPTVTEFKQKYDLLKADQLKKLRSELTQDYPATLEYFYAQSAACHKLNNAALFTDGAGPQTRCDGTTAMNLWPAAYNADGSFNLDPADLACHWSIPIVEGITTLTSCVGDQSGPNGDFDFFVNGDVSNTCLAVFHGVDGWREFCPRGCYVPVAKTAEYAGPGAAVWYGRSITYPVADCACGTANDVCLPPDAGTGV